MRRERVEVFCDVDDVAAARVYIAQRRWQTLAAARRKHGSSIAAERRGPAADGRGRLRNADLNNSWGAEEGMGLLSPSPSEPLHGSRGADVGETFTSSGPHLFTALPLRSALCK